MLNNIVNVKIFSMFQKAKNLILQGAANFNLILDGVGDRFSTDDYRGGAALRFKVTEQNERMLCIEPCCSKW